MQNSIKFGPLWIEKPFYLFIYFCFLIKWPFHPLPYSDHRSTDSNFFPYLDSIQMDNIFILDISVSIGQCCDYSPSRATSRTGFLGYPSQFILFICTVTPSSTYSLSDLLKLWTVRSKSLVVAQHTHRRCNCIES